MGPLNGTYCPEEDVVESGERVTCRLTDATSQWYLFSCKWPPWHRLEEEDVVESGERVTCRLTDATSQWCLFSCKWPPWHRLEEEDVVESAERVTCRPTDGPLNGAYSPVSGLRGIAWRKRILLRVARELLVGQLMDLSMVPILLQVASVASPGGRGCC
ncbi:hypothetical protein J6590_075141 [Homalodisca vitripennis]|nr:hypothetical protein J6590_075141 [Homalodisca vitripennis]